MIEDATDGRRVAQRALYERYAGVVYAICERYAGDAHAARDFAQEAWLTAFAKLGSYRHEGSFEGWLRKLTARQCITLLRKRGLRLEELPTVLPQGAHLAPEAIEQLAVGEILAQIAALPEGYRLVFNLVAVEGLSHAECAEALGIAESASRSQLTRARQALQRRLAQISTLCL